MRTTTRRIVTLATCGAAFALPVIAGGTAQAAETSSRLLNDRGASVSIYGSDNGTAGALAKGGNTGTTTTGNASGAASGQAKTILIAKLSPAKPYNSSSTNDYGWITIQQSRAGTTATGTVVALTKVGTTTIVSKYQAVANCEKSTYGYTSYHYGNYASASEGCQLSSTSGTYKAKGGAVAAGLPQTGSTELNSYSYSDSWSHTNGQQGNSSDNRSYQTFNNRDRDDEIVVGLG
ncbi:MAG: hypothetical protein JWN87_2350 [Frankiales bacterium]|nr:hypothetical protein [Frankiales bacterium]